jgi:hypothetical protein
VRNSDGFDRLLGTKAQQAGGFPKQFAGGRWNPGCELVQANGDGTALSFDGAMCLFSH